MVDASAEGPSRHPLLARLESELRKVTWDMALQNSAHDIEGDAAVALLPTVVWLPGPSDHPKSGRGLLPYPVTWQLGPTQRLQAGTAQHIDWIAQAWGHKVSGTLGIFATPAPSASRVPSPLVLDEDQLVRSVEPHLSFGRLAVTADVMSPSQQRDALRAIHHHAVEARWHLHELLQPWLRRSLDDSHRAVSAELRVPRVLDKLALEELFDTIHLGDPARPGLIDKVIHRLADPTQRRLKVDPARYIVTTFRRDTELALRRKIDDPRWLGPALRRFAQSNAGLTVEELVERFNASGCNTERIGVARALRALQPAVQPHTSYVSMDLVAAQQEPHPADVLLMPSRETGDDKSPRRRTA